jgi:hypothetical protein
LKAAIRYLVTTEAFQRDSRPLASASERDPENKLLTHFSQRRLEAEAIRDGMLALAGKLECTPGAPADGGSYRRSVYTKVIRNNLDPFLSAFDFPVPAATRGRRDSTNVPAQALTMLNDPSVIKWAGDWSGRILAEKELTDDAARLRRMFREAYARDATDEECERAAGFLAALSSDGMDRASAWRHLAQALFNTKEYLYLR